MGPAPLKEQETALAPALDIDARARRARYLLKRGLTPEQMRSHYSDRSLTLAEVHSALAYYCDNTDEIEALIESGERWEEEFEQRRADLVSARTGR